jgi:tripartite-type tricarboxylate transporter receptor subunit TctC
VNFSNHARFIARTVGVLMLLPVVFGGLAGCQPPEKNKNSEIDAASFYKGKKIKWIIPYSPGGGYDEYARLLSPYLRKYTGARFDILNLPGAGGMRGANELFTSPSDGLTIGMINGSALVTNELVGVKGADYKIGEFEFLGRVVADTHVLIVSNQSGYESFEQILNAEEEVKIGATGLGGSTYLDAVISKEAFGLNLNIIHGFDSSSVIRQAMLRGNIVGSWGSWGSAIDAVDSGRHIVVLQSGTERNADLPDVPTVFEMIEKSSNQERTLAIVTAWESLNAVGRPVAAAPGTPADKIRFLRAAFEKAMHDPELLKDLKQAGRAISYASGDEMSNIVESATAMPDDIAQLFVRAIKGEL